MYAMFAISYPLGNCTYSLVSNLSGKWWPYSDEDVRSILFLWALLFVPGYIQWFVLPTTIVNVWRRVQDYRTRKNAVDEQLPMQK